MAKKRDNVNVGAAKRFRVVQQMAKLLWLVLGRRLAQTALEVQEQQLAARFHCSFLQRLVNFELQQLALNARLAHG